MLISHAHRFIFIHIDRTAGTSIQQALARYGCQRANARWKRRLVWLGGANTIGGLYRSVEFGEHVTADTVRRCLPAACYASMFKFAFVRNPWDLLVSRHAYLLRKQEHPRHRLVTQMPNFADYLRWEIRRDKLHQHRYVTDGTGELIVDYIGRFENLDAHVGDVGRRLGLPVTLPHVNPSAHGDYRDYYTAVTRGWVEHAFRRDIELFGYSFDGADTTAPVLAPATGGGRAPAGARLRPEAGLA